MQGKDLLDFTERFIKAGCPVDYSIQSKVYVTDVSTSTLIYKSGKHCVEQYFMHPGAVVPLHSHPFYSITMLAMGKMKVKRGDSRWFLVNGVGQPNKDVLPPGVEHEFVTSDTGAMLYVISEWEDIRDIDSATIKYIGEPIGPIHKKLREDANEN